MTCGLDWLLDLFTSNNTRLELQSLARIRNTTVYSSLGHFFGCFLNFRHWRLELTVSLSLSLSFVISFYSNYLFFSLSSSNSRSRSHVKVFLRSMISQAVFPGIRSSRGARDQCFCLFHGKSRKTFPLFYYGALTLTRGRICNFQCSHSSVRAT
jgi:hypothetical protein